MARIASEPWVSVTLLPQPFLYCQPFTGRCIMYITHGKCHTPEYQAYNSMKKRCYLKTHVAYMRYGGRGISVCNRWLADFMNFYTDMGARPDGLTLERVDNSKGYSPENCCWATRKDQAHNTRRIKPFYARSPQGRWYFSRVQIEFARCHQLDHRNICRCLSKKYKSYKTHKGWVFWTATQDAIPE